MERGGHDGRVEGSRAKTEEKDDQCHNHKLLQYPAFLCVCMWGSRGRACITLFYSFCVTCVGRFRVAAQE